MNDHEKQMGLVDPQALFQQSTPELNPWNLSYRKALAAQPSWVQHGMPPLSDKFIELVKGASRDGIHLDIGCGNGIKTVNFALAGLKTIGVDISLDAIKEAKLLLDGHKLRNKCTFIEGSGLDLKFPQDSIDSATDILCFTHINDRDQAQYLRGIHNVLRNDGYFMLTLFSDQDEHFHGHPVSKKYVFHYDPNTMEQGYEHYEGMYNFHFGMKDIQEIFRGLFDITGAVHTRHPLYPHRYLWNVILQKDK